MPKRQGPDRLKRLIPLVFAGLSSDAHLDQAPHPLEPVVQHAPAEVEADLPRRTMPEAEHRAEQSPVAAYEQAKRDFDTTSNALKSYLDQLQYDRDQLSALQKRMQQDYVRLSQTIGNLPATERVEAEKKLVGDFFDLYTYKVTGTDGISVSASGLLDTPSGPMNGFLSTIYYDDPGILDYFEQVLTKDQATDAEDILVFMNASHPVADYIPDIIEDLHDQGRVDIKEETFSDAMKNADDLYTELNVYGRLFSGQ